MQRWEAHVSLPVRCLFFLWYVCGLWQLLEPELASEANWWESLSLCCVCGQHWASESIRKKKKKGSNVSKGWYYSKSLTKISCIPQSCGAAVHCCLLLEPACCCSQGHTVLAAPQYPSKRCTDNKVIKTTDTWLMSPVPWIFFFFPKLQEAALIFSGAWNNTHSLLIRSRQRFVVDDIKAELRALLQKINYSLSSPSFPFL